MLTYCPERYIALRNHPMDASSGRISFEALLKDSFDVRLTLVELGQVLDEALRRLLHRLVMEEVMAEHFKYSSHMSRSCEAFSKGALSFFGSLLMRSY